MIPSSLLPMLATAGALPVGDAWAYEVKWDGYRVLARVEDGRTTLRSRTGRDATLEFPELQLDLPDALVDGEVVVLVDGRPSFSALQMRSAAATFLPFDLLLVGDRSLLELPWEDRRALLRELCPDAPLAFDDGPALLETTRAQGLEGVVAKRRDSKYFPGRRTESWIKTKHVRRQSAVVVGWQRGEGGRAGSLGSLLLAAPGPEGLGYVGKVGTGFNHATLAMLQERLAPLARTTPPVVDPPRQAAEWVEPVLVVEVEFTDWTPDGRLRHPSYKGLRDDVRPEEVVRE
jgi:bifunctional non-homologous end joining protein LigD